MFSLLSGFQETALVESFEVNYNFSPLGGIRLCTLFVGLCTILLAFQAISSHSFWVLTFVFVSSNICHFPNWPIKWK